MNRYVLISFCLLVSMVINAQDCNGFNSLCNKRYDEVVYLTTHNAFNYGPDFNAPNQNFPVAQQLSDGVRALMLDIYEQNGEVVMYHGVSFLGQQPLDTALMQIKSFLDTHPSEIVTIIFESYASVTLVEAVFQSTQLMPYLHTQAQGQAWPTLQNMIDSGKRLVVMTDDNDNLSPTWYHYVWNYAVETHFSNHSYADFDCSFNRGVASNSLFILNHFVTDPNFGLGIADSAVIVNEYNKLYSRAQSCQTVTGKLPNFLTVDFYDLGYCQAVTCALNGENCSTVPTELSVEDEIPRVFPNPASNNLSITAQSGIGKAILYNSLGQKVEEYSVASNTVISIDKLSDGMYLLILSEEKGHIYQQKIIIQH